MKSIPFLSLFVLVPSLVFAALDPAKIETATGLKGTFNEAEGVFKVTQPRADVKITVLHDCGNDRMKGPFARSKRVGSRLVETKPAPSIVMSR